MNHRHCCVITDVCMKSDALHRGIVGEYSRIMGRFQSTTMSLDPQIKWWMVNVEH